MVKLSLGLTAPARLSSSPAWADIQATPARLSSASDRAPWESSLPSARGAASTRTACKLARMECQLGNLLIVLGDDCTGAAVAKDERALFGRGGGINGHRDQPGHRDGDVAQQPFEPGLAQERHSIPAIESQGKQSGSQLACRLVGLPPGEAVPSVRPTVSKGWAIREFANPALPDTVRAATCWGGGAAFGRRRRHGTHIVIAARAQIKAMPCGGLARPWSATARVNGPVLSHVRKASWVVYDERLP